MIHDLLLVELFDVEYNRDLEMWVRDHCRSLKVIFSDKEWPDLEICVWGCSRSLKMALFNRPCMTFYSSDIVTIALSCTNCELFDVE